MLKIGHDVSLAVLVIAKADDRAEFDVDRTQAVHDRGQIRADRLAVHGHPGKAAVSALTRLIRLAGRRIVVGKRAAVHDLQPQCFCEVILFAFDLLELNGEDTRPHAFNQRRPPRYAR